MPELSESRVWEAIQNEYSHDKDYEAVTFADAAVDLIRRGSKQLAIEKRQAKKEKLRIRLECAIEAYITSLWKWYAALIILSIVGYGIFYLATMGNHDYAGYGPNNVVGHAAYALEYRADRNGQGNPRFLGKSVFISQERSRWGGRTAWLVKYRNLKSNSVICTWVWLDNYGDNYEYGVGKECTRNM